MRGPGAGPRHLTDGLRRRAATAGERATAAVAAARQRSRAVDAAAVALQRDREAVGAVLAGAVAFRLFVFMLPLTLGVVTLLGVARVVDGDSPEALGDSLGMSSYLVGSVEEAAEQSRRGLWVLVPLATVAVYTGGVGLVRVIHAVHALAWGQRPTKLRGGFTVALAAFGLMAVAFAVVAGLQGLRNRSAGLGLALALAGFVPFAGLWLVAARLLPHDPRAGWRALVPGAALVGLAVWGGHLISAYYLARRVEKASELYGSLGVAAAILAWLFVMARVMVASAMLNATLWERDTATRRG